MDNSPKKLEELFHKALLGLDVHNEVYIYSQEKIIEIIIEKNKCEMDEALSEFEFNFMGARYSGTPIYLADF